METHISSLASPQAQIYDTLDVGDRHELYLSPGAHHDFSVFTFGMHESRDWNLSKNEGIAGNQRIEVLVFGFYCAPCIRPAVLVPKLILRYHKPPRLRNNLIGRGCMQNQSYFQRNSVFILLCTSNFTIF